MKVKTWLANFERNVPTKYPTLMCGWPDEDHGIHWDAYQEDCAARIEDMDEGSDAPALPTFSQWRENRRDADPERDVLGFSWQVCDLCGAAAGERHAVTAYDAEMKEHCGLSVCSDCVCYIANGDLPEED